jgi:hypothetical protein
MLLLLHGFMAVGKSLRFLSLSLSLSLVSAVDILQKRHRAGNLE